MSALRGALTGALSLIALQTVVSSTDSASRVGGLFTDLASIVERGLSPAVALIPDLRGRTSASSSSSSTGGSGTAQLPSSTFNPSTVPTPRPATPTVPAPVIAPSSSRTT